MRRAAALKSAALTSNHLANRLRRRSLFVALDRPGILSFGIDIAVDELDDAKRRVIAEAEAGFQNARIAAVALFVPWPEHVEELLHERDVTHLSDRLAAGMQIAALAERDQLLDDGPQILRLRQGRDDLLVLDQGLRHV